MSCPVYSLFCITLVCSNTCEPPSSTAILCLRPFSTALTCVRRGKCAALGGFRVSGSTLLRMCQIFKLTSVANTVSADVPQQAHTLGVLLFIPTCSCSWPTTTTRTRPRQHFSRRGAKASRSVCHLTILAHADANTHTCLERSKEATLKRRLAVNC